MAKVFEFTILVLTAFFDLVVPIFKHSCVFDLKITQIDAADRRIQSESGGDHSQSIRDRYTDFTKRKRSSLSKFTLTHDFLIKCSSDIDISELAAPWSSFKGYGLFRTIKSCQIYA